MVVEGFNVAVGFHLRRPVVTLATRVIVESFNVAVGFHLRRPETVVSEGWDIIASMWP